MAKKATKKAAKKSTKKAAAKKSALLSLSGNVPAQPGSAHCTLTTLPSVHNCLHPAISSQFNKPNVTDSTDLRLPTGLGLDELSIRTDLYATVVLAVRGAGCRIRFLSPSHIVACKRVGDICALVWADLNQP